MKDTNHEEDIRSIHSVRVSDKLWRNALDDGFNISRFLEKHLREHFNPHTSNNTPPRYSDKIDLFTRNGNITKTDLKRISKETSTDMKTLREHGLENRITIIHI